MPGVNETVYTPKAGNSIIESKQMYFSKFAVLGVGKPSERLP